ncbi:hypothetical protein SAMD00019534_102370 [Acytostelium subglobosum LB1]|uniref:hypothetical protein n=1 Tax=Acytostelium subglobosum LB1 TaxID=1410327 RepID=UPI000644827F|nr:hypothetical protein SAMD00019534_102370 [Acytostelium subglobosum LB1]GAM27062.1 hypothetical protein SAMD00019534_102370 [Acytostelium subglobosum LB1]|eukprot:XP_012749942.1 hypothetical protein SAMD00019534_102370 [Acytostelium subglobosum LB1]
MSQQQALEAKNKGNAAFTAKKFEEAVGHFTDAIALDPSNHILYSNRSACFNNMKQFEKALEDANKTVELKPDWAKSYLRLANAFVGLTQYDDADKAVKKGLELEPENEQLIDLQIDVVNFLNPTPPGQVKNMFGPEGMTKLMFDSRTKDFLKQPDFMAKMQDLAKTPGNITKYMGDKRMVTALSVIMGIDLSNATFDNDPNADPFKDDDESEAPMPSKPAPQQQPPQQPPQQQQAPQQEKPKQPEPTKAKPAAPELPESQKERELGNQFYKEKNFDAAIKHYERAFELDPNDLLALNNKAAVFMEQQRYDECIELCTSAIEKAREIRADYKIRAKIYTRLGNAYMKKDDLDNALKNYNHAIVEDKTADTIANLSRAEKLKKERTEKAYLSTELSLVAKNQGNEHFKKGEYPEAIKSFDEAVRRNPTDHTIYSNRSATYAKLTEYPRAIKDAEKCMELAPNFVKGYIRKANALFAMREYQNSLQICDQGLRVEENNPELVDLSQRNLLALNKQQSSMTDEERLAEAAKNPEILEILQDPVMNQILKDMSTNPGAAQDHLKNPLVREKFEKLVKAGVVKIGGR